MHKVIRTVIMLSVVFAVIGMGTPASAAGEGTISGELVNGTAGGAPVNGIELILTAFANGQPGTEQTAMSDEEGKFQFSGLSIDAATTYGITTRFQDADYFSRPVQLTTENPDEAVQINVYDSTTSDEFIEAVNAHLLISADQGAIEITEVWRFTNAGDKTYIGQADASPVTTLMFTLPAGATTVVPGEGFEPVATDTGVADTLPVMPGPIDISFSYVLHYEGSGVTLSRKADYDIGSFGILMKDTGAKVSSAALGQSEVLEMGDTKYLFLSKKDIPAGMDIDASFANLGLTSSGPTPNSGQGFAWPWLISVALALALVAVLVYPQYKKRQAVGVTANESQIGNGFDEARDDTELLRDMAQMDDDYEAGKINTEEYQSRRAQTKARLIEIRSRRTGGQG